MNWHSKEYVFYSVHYQNRLQERFNPCHVYKIVSRSFQNQVPITAELRVIFRKQWAYTLGKCRRAFKTSRQRMVKEIWPFFVLLKSARFSSVPMKTSAILDFMLFRFQPLKTDRPRDVPIYVNEVRRCVLGSYRLKGIHGIYHAISSVTQGLDFGGFLPMTIPI